MGLHFGCRHDLLTYCVESTGDLRVAQELAQAISAEAKGRGLHWGDDWKDAVVAELGRRVAKEVKAALIKAMV